MVGSNTGTLEAVTGPYGFIPDAIYGCGSGSSTTRTGQPTTVSVTFKNGYEALWFWVWFSNPDGLPSGFDMSLGGKGPENAGFPIFRQSSPFPDGGSLETGAMLGTVHFDKVDSCEIAGSVEVSFRSPDGGQEEVGRDRGTFDVFYTPSCQFK